MACYEYLQQPSYTGTTLVTLRMTGLLTRWDTAAGAWSTLACKDQELIPYDIPNVDYSWGLTSLDHTHTQPWVTTTSSFSCFGRASSVFFSTNRKATCTEPQITESKATVIDHVDHLGPNVDMNADGVAGCDMQSSLHCLLPLGQICLDAQISQYSGLSDLQGSIIPRYLGSFTLKFRIGRRSRIVRLILTEQIHRLSMDRIHSYAPPKEK